MRSRRSFVLMVFPVLALALAPSAIRAQDAEPRAPSVPMHASVLAGTLGSAAGAVAFGMAGAALSSDCSVENWGCTLSRAAIAGAAGSVVGSVTGTHLLARWQGASPSVGAEILAATAGVFAGALVGAGVMHALGTEDERWFLVGYSVTQGALTAFVARHTARGR